MDYILFGMGFGASLMLLGWALRTFGPAWKYADVSRDDSTDRYVYKRFWNRFVQGLGGVLAIAGTAMVVLTFLVMLLNPADETGEMFALVVWVAISLIVFGWCWAYLRRYGTTGIWSQEEGYGFRSRRPKPARVATSSRRIPQANLESTAASESVESPVEEAGDAALAEPAYSDIEPAAEEAEDIDPDYDFGDSTDTTVPSEPTARETRSPEHQEQASEG